MATRKQRPVLFELVSRTRKPTEPPDRPRTTTTVPITGASVAASKTPTPPATPATAAPRFGAAHVGVSDSLNLNRGIIIAVASLFVLIITWQVIARLWNRTPGPTTAPSAAEKVQSPPTVESPRTVRRQPGNSPVVTPLTPNAPPNPTDRTRTAEEPAKPREEKKKEEASPAAPAAPGPTPAAARMSLQKGQHYVVVQHFKLAERAAAQQAREFLTSRGIPCSIDESPREIRLIVDQPFPIDNSDKALGAKERQRADQVIRQVKQLGREYSKTNGYAFDQCYANKF